MDWFDYLQPYNLVFVGPLLFGLFLILPLLMGFGHGHTGAGHGHIHGHHTVRLGHGAQRGVRTSIRSHGHTHTVEPDEGGAWQKTLWFFGIGKVPINIILVVFCLVWGFSGLVTNLMIESFQIPITVLFWVSLIVAALCSTLCTRYIAKIIHHFLPGDVSFGVEKKDLVGFAGEVNNRLTATSGSALVFDQYNNLHEVQCRVPAEQEIKRGTKIYLGTFDPTTQTFTVLTQEQLDKRLS